MQFNRDEPSPANRFQAGNTNLIVSSYQHLLQRELLPATPDAVALAHALYHAPFVVLAHDTAPDPVFFYANLTAQSLFDMSWHDMVQLPSRHSAEPLQREERQRLLDCVRRQGYIDDYAGVRISATGKRFRIARASVWNLLDASAECVGQAASFSAWEAV